MVMNGRVHISPKKHYWKDTCSVSAMKDVRRPCRFPWQRTLSGNHLSRIPVLPGASTKNKREYWKDKKNQCKRLAMHARITMFTSKRVARAACIKSLEVASKKSKHENQYMRDNTPTAGWLARILLPRSVLMRRLSTKNKIRTLNASVRLTAQKVRKYAEKSGT